MKFWKILIYSTVIFALLTALVFANNYVCMEAGIADILFLCSSNWCLFTCDGKIILAYNYLACQQMYSFDCHPWLPAMIYSVYKCGCDFFVCSSKYWLYDNYILGC